MMRIIDADEIIKEQRKNMELLYGKIGAELNKHMDIDDDKSIYIHSMETYSRAKQFYHGLKGILENAQTVDAVPVVHCRDCKFDGLTECPLCYIEKHELIFVNHDGDFFCGKGKRKDEEGE